VKAMPSSPAATTVIDTILFRDAFGTPRMREVFSDHALLSRYIEVEIALARAEARCGVIPREAADEIAAKCNVATLDLDLLRQETEIVGYPILPLVHQLVKQCGDAGRYVHWGATTQDIMDTAVVLQLREGLGIIEEDVAQLRSILAKLAKTHRDTPMAGRTHLQQALPITFGYKAAIWLAMFDRHAERLTQLKPRVLVGEFAGAAGTLASLGEKGLEVQKAFCEELRVGVPVSTWHVARDAFAETITLLALITGSLGKIALDIMLMAATELAEVYEPFVKRARRIFHDASEAQPDLIGADARRREGGAPACRPDARCDDPGLRARDRALAHGVDCHSGKLRAHGGRAASSKVCARRPDRRREADGQESRPQPRAHRCRSGDDGLGPPARPARGARPRL
jgi:hypothetical protein